MCGISGIINKKNKKVNDKEIKEINDLIIHRGPDDEGFYFENNNQDFEILHSRCEACGKKGVEALMLSAINLDLKYKFLDYRTSADFSQDESSVVGYMSALFY